ncbi:hypothetical protein P7H74_10115 [Enterococcus devriesei]|uniref:hypothetical protein n=1 Tax=Enterococcus devriesei TaxID=319970 RepID=UPI001FEA74C2|nr:hypothetical protein [Enterococcus devriesei]MDT2822092.1 hypothetical protein [Enterococcus devriesei]
MKAIKIGLKGQVRHLNWRIIKIIGSFLFIIVGLLLFYCGYSNWQMDQEFIASDKGRSLGTVHIDRNGVQTISFPENSYGVAIDGDDRKEGEQVYIYYQKNKPYRISTSPKYYQTKEDLYKPFLGGVFFIGYVLFIQFMLPKILQRLLAKADLLASH